MVRQARSGRDVVVYKTSVSCSFQQNAEEEVNTKRQRVIRYCFFFVRALGTCRLKRCVIFARICMRMGQAGGAHETNGASEKTNDHPFLASARLFFPLSPLRGHIPVHYGVIKPISGRTAHSYPFHILMSAITEQNTAGGLTGQPNTLKHHREFCFCAGTNRRDLSFLR